MLQVQNAACICMYLNGNTNLHPNSTRVRSWYLGQMDSVWMPEDLSSPNQFTTYSSRLACAASIKVKESYNEKVQIHRAGESWIHPSYRCAITHLQPTKELNLRWVRCKNTGSCDPSALRLIGCLGKPDIFNSIFQYLQCVNENSV